MNPELIKIAQQLMQQNPGMTPEQALREAGRMSQGAQSEDFVGGQAREAGRLGHMAQQQYAATQGGPAMGQVPGDIPQVMPGLQSLVVSKVQMVCVTTHSTTKRS
jgi:hypothetical protein